MTLYPLDKVTEALRKSVFKAFPVSVTQTGNKNPPKISNAPELQFPQQYLMGFIWYVCRTVQLLHSGSMVV